MPEKNRYQTGKRNAQRHEVRKKCNGNELCGRVSVAGIIGCVFVRVRMRDELSVNDMRVGKTGDACHQYPQKRFQSVRYDTVRTSRLYIQVSLPPASVSTPHRRVTIYAPHIFRAGK